MGLETTTTIAGLVATNPVASDPVGQADDHLRLLKNVLKTIFPGAGGVGFSIPITATETELNYVDGVTSAIQTQLNTLSAAASTADGKAVDAQADATQALADAATAQSTADDATTDAATAQNGANLALAAASVADGKAVAAQADATKALAGAADAWVIFNGNTGAIKKAYNVSGVVRNSTGNYTVSFTNNMPATDYVIQCRGSSAFATDMSRAVSNCVIGCFTTFTTVTYTDTGEVAVAIFAS